MNRVTVETTASGKFRICPICKRHVPPGIVECRCGIDLPEVASPPPAAARGLPLAPVLWTSAVVLAFLVGREVGRSDVPAAMQEKAFIPYPMRVWVAAPTPEPHVAPWNLGPGLPAATTPTPVPTLPPIAVALAPSPRPWEAALEPSPSPDASKTEAHWQGRLAETRDRIQSSYQACLAEFQKAGVPRGDVGMAWTETPGGIANVDGARAALVSALASQAELEEAARRAGVPAGWVRFDWAGYPRLVGPGSGGHPCSVPDLLRTIGY